MKISIQQDSKASPEHHMEKDKKLLNQLDPNGLPLLRHYDWSSDSITYGVFAKPCELFNIKGLKQHQIEIAKRVTGGGATLHFSDLAFSFFLPKNHPKFSENTLENYALVNRLVAKALSNWLPEEDLIYAQKESSSKPEETLFFCMNKLTQYDVLYQGRKVAGAAQRKKANGLLHHGSIAIARPDPKVLSDILKNPEAVKSILQLHHYFVENHLMRDEVHQWRERLRKALNQAFEDF